MIVVIRSQEISQHGFFLWAEVCRKLDLDSHNKISPFGRLLAAWHAKTWVFFFPCWLCRASVPDGHLPAVDGLNRAFPAG